MLFQGSIGAFPFESVIITIEVKTRLDVRELKSSHESAKEIMKYKHCVSPTKRIEDPIACLFAFDSDLQGSGKSEIERYASLIGDGEPALRMICVAGKGSWHWNNGKWNDWGIRGENGEVVSFMIAIANRIQEVSESRNRPNILDYVFYEHDEDKI